MVVRACARARACVCVCARARTYVCDLETDRQTGRVLLLLYIHKPDCLVKILEFF